MGTLRFVLAAAVVIWHAGAIYGWRPFNGTACVNYFFMISGFYMALILTRKYTGPDRLSLFWSNRALRLWPSFVFISLLLAILRYDEIAAVMQKLDGISAVLAIAMNAAMVGYEFFDLLSFDAAGRFRFDWAADAVRDAKPLALLGQGWSIGLEIWFYLLAPFVVTSLRRTAMWLLLGLLIFVASNFWVPDESWKYRFFPNVMVFFALGVLSFHLGGLLGKSRFSEIFTRIAVWGMLPLTLLCLLLPSAMSVLVPEQHHLKFLLVLALPCLPAWFEATQRWKLDRLLGELSYPLYLNHLLIVIVLRPVFMLSEEDANTPIAALQTACVLSGTIVLAYLMVRFIEQPIDTWRQRRVAKSET